MEVTAFASWNASFHLSSFLVKLGLNCFKRKNWDLLFVRDTYPNVWPICVKNHNIYAQMSSGSNENHRRVVTNWLFFIALLILIQLPLTFSLVYTSFLSCSCSVTLSECRKREKYWCLMKFSGAKERNTFDLCPRLVAFNCCLQRSASQVQYICCKIWFSISNGISVGQNIFFSFSFTK